MDTSGWSVTISMLVTASETRWKSLETLCFQILAKHIKTDPSAKVPTEGSCSWTAQEATHCSACHPMQVSTHWRRLKTKPKYPCRRPRHGWCPKAMAEAPDAGGQGIGLRARHEEQIVEQWHRPGYHGLCLIALRSANQNQDTLLCPFVPNYPQNITNLFVPRSP